MSTPRGRRMLRVSVCTESSDPARVRQVLLCGLSSVSQPNCSHLPGDPEHHTTSVKLHILNGTSDGVLLNIFVCASEQRELAYGSAEFRIQRVGRDTRGWLDSV